MIPSEGLAERARRVAVWEALVQVYFAVDKPEATPAQRHAAEQLSERFAQRLIARFAPDAGWETFK